jgi:hypothetical protein
MIYNATWFPGKNTPYTYINQGNALNLGTEVLTGHKVPMRDFWNTPLETIRKDLTTAVANNKVVTVSTGGGDATVKKLLQQGIVGAHVYTVVAYDSVTDTVRLRNPWGENPVFDNGTDPNFWLGKNGAEQPNPPVNDGYFWMPLSDIAKKFTQISFEQ